MLARWLGPSTPFFKKALHHSDHREACFDRVNGIQLAITVRLSRVAHDVLATY